MSNGPISREREAWAPTPVSNHLTGVARICLDWRGRGYCGRRSGVSRVRDWAFVECADCLAAGRADRITGANRP